MKIGFRPCCLAFAKCESHSGFEFICFEIAKMKMARTAHLKEEALVGVDRRLGPIDNLVEGQLPAVGQNEGDTASLQIQTCKR